jgi:hypothetical protein
MIVVGRPGQARRAGPDKDIVMKSGAQHIASMSH